MSRMLNRRDAIKGAVSAAALTSVRTAAAALATPIHIGAAPAEISVHSVSPTTVRITIVPLPSNAPVAFPSDGAVVWEPKEPPLLRINSLESSRECKAGELRVRLSPRPLSMRIERRDGTTVQEILLDESTGDLRFRTDGGLVLGMGQGGPQFDRKGHDDAMVSGQGGYRLETHGARVPVQFLLGTAGWGLFVHAPLGVFDLSGSEGRFRPATDGQRLPIDLFVMGAAAPSQILADYARITGFPEMPPLWTLGYQQSYRTLGTPEDILSEAQTFRDKKLPCDALIYLGTGFCPNGWNTDNGEFTWNPRTFPDPQKALDRLHAEHFKVALHIVLEGERLTGAVQDACTAPPLPTGRTPDHHWPPDRQVSCYWPAHKPPADLGVDGWWPDQGDGLDAPSRLARIRMYFDGQQMYRPNQRVYALHRNGYAGMQRYAAFLWSGDVLSRWETLRTHVPNAINTGLSGIPYWGTDIGGFIPTDEYTGELYARWFQFAAFCPLFRSHGRDWKLHRPWGWNTGDLGYPETRGYQPDPAELHNASIEPICRKYLELRYRLVPYIYTSVRETCQTGLPVMRSLWLHYPDDPQAVQRGDEYLFGPDLLVAPVVEKSAATRNVYLPHGIWHDFWTNEKHEGGLVISRNVDLGTLPLYVRAGAVIPMDPVRQYTSEIVEGPLTLTVYPGADGRGILYRDDGESFDFHNGAYMQVEMQWTDAQRRLDLHLSQGARMLGLAVPMQIQLAGSTATKTIRFDGTSVSVTL